MIERPDDSKPEFQVAIGLAFHVAQSAFLSDGYYRVCLLDKTYDLVYLKRLPTTSPAKKGTSDKQRKVREVQVRCVRAHILQEMLKNESARLISEVVVDQRLSDREEMGKRQREIYDQRLPILTAMMEPLQFSMLIGGGFTQSAKVLGEKFQIPTIQVKRLFHRLLEAGLDIHSAAVTSHKRCGKRSNAFHEKKQGRKRRYVKNGRAPDWAGVNTNKLHIADLDVFIKSAFLPAKSRVENFRLFKSKFAVQNHLVGVDGRVTREMLPEHQFITIDQFGYHLKKRVEVLRSQLTRETTKALESQVKKKALGTARQGIPYPGHTLIIDSTVADVWLVSAWDRSKLIGRPVIYVVIDAFSSVVVGIHVSLFNPSAAEAKIALFRALTDKGEFLKKYGVEKYHSFLPICPVPYELVFDRAELLSVEGKAVGMDLQINIGVPPAYFPEWKAIVERHFGILNKTAIHWLPGSTQGRQRERGEKDVRLDAILTLHEFTQIVLRGVFQWNLRGTPSALMRPDQVVETGSTSPIDIFNWGLENLHGTPRYLDFEKAATTLLPFESYSIGDRGIKTKTLQWVGAWMNEGAFFGKGILDRPAKLFRSPDEPTMAFVKLQTEQVLRKASLTSRFAVENDYTRFDLDDMAIWMQDSQSIHREKTVGIETTSDHETFEIVKQAEKATAFANDVNFRSKAEKTRNTSENRRAEIAAHAVVENVDKCSPSKPTPPQTSPESSYNDPDFLKASDEWEEE